MSRCVRGFLGKVRRRRPRTLVFYDPGRLTAREATIVAAKAAGCTCNPEVELLEWRHGVVDGIRAAVSHDHRCSLGR